MLQPRDLHLLREAAILKVFDRLQAQFCAGFHSASRANVRLPKLVKAGLLNHFFVATEKGGKKSIFSLTRKGAAVAEVSFLGIKRSKGKLLNFAMPALIPLGPQKMLENAKAGGLIVPLKGYRIHVVGASTAGLNPQSWNTVKEFWALYFHEAGADVVLYSAETEIQRD